MVAAEHLAPQTLAALELFHGLTLPALCDAHRAARVRRMSAGTSIFNQGDPGVRAHVLVEGSVRISQWGSDGAQTVMRFISPKEMYGTVALFTDGRYPADAVALTPSLEASWSEAELFALMGHHPKIAINVIRVIGKRLQEAQDRVRELSTQPAQRRVAHALLRLAHQAGYRTTEGTAIAFPLRRKDVAALAGTTLHTASRILTAWERAGFAMSRNRWLTIRDTEVISRIADGQTD